MKKILMLFCAFFVLAGCNRAPVIDIRAEAETIKNIEDQWTAAIRAKDIDKIIGIYAPEAVAMNANTPACIGTQAIRESMESWLADTAVIHSEFESGIDTIEISVSGDLAYVRGNSRISISTPVGIIEETDKWVTIYKKMNSEWKAIVDIWNSDMP